jgi:hypothetical protein
MLNSKPVDRTARIDCLAIVSDDEVPNALRLLYRTDLEQCLAVGVSETICAETERQDVVQDRVGKP